MPPRQREESENPSSPEDGSNFRRSLQIDMKGLVGSAVGNMSIGPGSRDVVLASRKGLFIIDLEAPLNVPRFLPQGGTWDVADVQWNPHHQRADYIVSTSSEKLLIWNLLLTGKTSIEHILRSHYRAITDINWHTYELDTVVSTGIDSWLWAWDLRTPRKPVMGLCAFNASGTQVKWNRQDGNILASSHGNEVLIWDRRKGSLPASRIIAHNAKIYGIDWAHARRNELVTCSLDKTVKVWDVQHPTDSQGLYSPKTVIHTTNPVWRARDLPFGHGVLSLPQRGSTALEMWVPDSPSEPIEKFEGHTDVVKEFVWRRGGPDDSDFQLITWSKDKTLRFWPVDREVLQKAGSSDNHTGLTVYTHPDSILSFSNPPLGSDLPPVFSAPVGGRSILAEVRASQKPMRPGVVKPPHEVLPAAHNGVDLDQITKQSTTASSGKGKGRDRAPIGKAAQITTFAWLQSVKVGGRRAGSEGGGSGGESGTVSRLSSRSRPPSVFESPSQPTSEVRRSGEKGKTDDEYRESDANQSLQDEITSVVNKLTSSKVKLEKADLTKKRTCTFGLHGPWGESTSVFIRISFTFPRDYPQAVHPGGTPLVDLERNPLISMKNRIVILRRLRAIRHQRPCLEACLRFLLFGEEDGYIGHRPSAMDSESSSEDEAHPAVSRKPRDTASSLLRGDKNLAEPRTSQGVFGANGQLVCFFRAPPRIVKNTAREISVSPSIGSRGPETTTPRVFRSPALLLDAVRLLTAAANDREVEDLESKHPEDASSILRIMSNLFMFSHQKARKFSEQSRQVEETPTSYSLLQQRRSTVYIKDTSAYIGLDIDAAADYLYTATNPLDWCKKNADVARAHGRIDHERIFTMLQVMLVDAQKSGSQDGDAIPGAVVYSHLMMKLTEKLYAELLLNKDIQMLAMMSVMVFGFISIHKHSSGNRHPEFLTPASQVANLDYFSFARRHLARKDSTLALPNWSRVSPSPTSQPIAPSLDSPTSSRGSWSSLFNASNMRRFMSGMQDTSREDPRRVSDGMHDKASRTAAAIPVPVGRPQTGSQSPRARGTRKGSPLSMVPPVSNSWSEAVGSTKTIVSFSSAGHTRRRPTFSQIVSSAPFPAEKKRIIFEVDPKMKLLKSASYDLQPQMREQLACHILAYAEMLTAWQLPQKRNELLKSTESVLRDVFNESLVLSCLETTPLGAVRICPECGHENHLESHLCVQCERRLAVLYCSICRLPMKGLSHTCLQCLHSIHVKCWTARKDTSCATGCGCLCRKSTSELHEEEFNPDILTTSYSYTPLISQY